MTDYESEIVARAQDRSRDALTKLAASVYYAAYPGTTIPFSEVCELEREYCIRIANAVRESIEGIY